MATLGVDWPQPPASLDNDDATTYVLGVEFDVTEELPCVGIGWVTPSAAGSTPVGGTHYATLHADGAQVRKVTVTPTGGTEQFTFSTYTLVPGVTYVAQVYTRRYPFRGGSFPYPGPGALASKISANVGRLSVRDNGDSDSVATTSTSGIFYVSPVIEEGGAPPEIHTTTGTATVVVTARATTAGARPVAAAASLATTATAIAATLRATAGAAAVAPTATASVATSRTRTGAAALVLTARAAVSGRRVTAGTAAVYVTGGSYSAAGAPGPWLETRSRPAPVITRSRRA